jgi:predicted nucleic acid-binding protein
MRVLVDTNILIRISQKNHPQFVFADAALQKLWDAKHELRIVPQVLYEYWAVATRAVEHNGLGFSVQIVAADLERFKTLFSVLRDERGVLEPWQRLALENQAVGKRSHDVRLVAAMQRHGLTHLLTFNAADFKRFSGITLLDPLALVTG